MLARRTAVASIPAALNTLGLTARIYAIVIKVVIPAITSVFTVVLCSLSLNFFSNIIVCFFKHALLSFGLIFFSHFLIIQGNPSLRQYKTDNSSLISVIVTSLIIPAHILKLPAKRKQSSPLPNPTRITTY